MHSQQRTEGEAAICSGHARFLARNQPRKSKSLLVSLTIGCLQAQAFSGNSDEGSDPRGSAAAENGEL